MATAELEFSLTNISNLIKENRLTSEILELEFINRPNLVQIARETGFKKDGYGSWDRVAQLTDKLLLDSGWTFSKKSASYNANVSYFATTNFIKQDDLSLFEMISEFSFAQVCYLCSRKVIVIHLTTIIKNHLNDDAVLSKLGIMFFIHYLFACAALCPLSCEDEIRLCAKILHLYKQADPISLYLIRYRLDTLNKKRTIQTSVAGSAQRKFKVALIVAGQLRGFERAMPTFKDKFAQLGDVDAFVSTWDNVGVPSFNMGGYARLLEKDAFDYAVKENLFNQNINAFLQKRIPMKSTQEIKSSLYSLLSWCNSVFINIKNETSIQYSMMNNVDKLFYNNYYWIQEKGTEFFRQYDFIIRIRPDLKFGNLLPISVDTDKNYQVLSEEPFVFKEWGFGMGDQFWLCRAEIGVKLLQIYANQSVRTFCKNLYSIDYGGHQSTSLLAWIEGLEPERVGGTYLVSTFDKITLSEIIDYHHRTKGNC